MLPPSGFSAASPIDRPPPPMSTHARRPSDGAAPRVYEVEPTGAFENDPNVTDKKFPGNPTRSFRSTEPLRVVAEVHDWTRLTPEALQMWRDTIVSKAPADRGEIIN